MSEPIVVFDIGGTNLRAALFDPPTRRVGSVLRRPTPSFLTMPRATNASIRDAVFAGMREMVCELVGEPAPSVIGRASCRERVYHPV